MKDIYLCVAFMMLLLVAWILTYIIKINNKIDNLQNRILYDYEVIK